MEKTCEDCGKVKAISKFRSKVLRQGGTWYVFSICQACRKKIVERMRRERKVSSET